MSLRQCAVREGRRKSVSYCWKGEGCRLVPRNFSHAHKHEHHTSATRLRPPPEFLEGLRFSAFLLRGLFRITHTYPPCARTGHATTGYEAIVPQFRQESLFCRGKDNISASFTSLYRPQCGCMLRKNLAKGIVGPCLGCCAWAPRLWNPAQAHHSLSLPQSCPDSFLECGRARASWKFSSWKFSYAARLYTSRLSCKAVLQDCTAVVESVV